MPNQQLSDYIESEIKLGKSVEEIKITLLSIGWKEEDINTAINQNQNAVQVSQNNQKLKSKIKIISLILILFILLMGILYFYYNKNTNKIIITDPYIKEAPLETIKNKLMGINLSYPNYIHRISSHYHEQEDDTMTFYKNSDNVYPVFEVRINYEKFNPLNFEGISGPCGSEPEELSPLIFSLFTEKAHAICITSYKVKNIATTTINNNIYYSFAARRDVVGIYNAFILPRDGFYLSFSFYNQDPNTIRDIMNSVTSLPSIYTINYNVAYNKLINSNIYRKLVGENGPITIDSYSYTFNNIDERLNGWDFNISQSGRNFNRDVIAVDNKKIYYSSSCSPATPSSSGCKPTEILEQNN